jgi:hypothetical protein
MQNIARTNEIKLLSILCLVILLGMQANLTALFLSFEENHQLSFTKKGQECFLVLEHKSNSFSTPHSGTESRYLNTVSSDNSKQDHMIQLDHSESYKEAASNIDELLAPILLNTSNNTLSIISLSRLRNSIENGIISRLESFTQAAINLKSFIGLLSGSIFLRL